MCFFSVVKKGAVFSAVASMLIAGTLTTADALTNLATGGTATQSSTGWGGDAVRGIDGNTDGYFWNGSVTHTNSEAAWWQVDLGKTDTLSNITIWNRTDCCGERLSNFYVDVLDNNGNVVWNNSYAAFLLTTTAGTPGTTSAGMSIDLPSIVGETVKIGFESGSPNYLSLAEVQVFGAPVPEPSTVVLLGLGLAGLAVRQFRKRKC